MVEPNRSPTVMGSALEDKVNAAHPITVGVDDNYNEDDDADEDTND